MAPINCIAGGFARSRPAHLPEVLASEAAYVELVNKARGEAEAIVLVADATALSLRKAAAIVLVADATALSLRKAEAIVLVADATALSLRKAEAIVLFADATALSLRKVA
ncbi:hypothetical protein T484DRAFT_1807203 [Baffinella frigidus]|nr:hypothetical protein T484DRAFT_1807203 [Cryptophyta sp. CCMP2293]